MKFRYIFLIFLICSCTPHLETFNQKKPFSSKGFVYIYNHVDFEKKIIKGKMNNDLMQISHQYLKRGTLVKIINPKTKKSIVIKNTKRIQYPDFYKLLITNAVATKLELNADLPILEIIEMQWQLVCYLAFFFCHLAALFLLPCGVLFYIAVFVLLPCGVFVLARHYFWA